MVAQRHPGTFKGASAGRRFGRSRRQRQCPCAVLLV